MEETKKWYQSNLVIIVCLILFFPLGLLLMWKSSWNKPVKIAISSFFAFMVLVGSTKNTPTPQKNTSPAPSPTAAISSVPSVPATSPSPSDVYDAKKRSKSPNAGFPSTVVIPISEVNETDMKTLGDRFNEASKGSDFVFISVYSDQKAADLREKVVKDIATKSETAFYDKYYVGQYTKNGTTGFNQFEMHINGLNGETKVIKY